MPSPTSSTRPTSRACSLGRYSSISDWRTETISSTLNLMTASRDQLVANGFELRAHRGVVQPVADADGQAAQQVGGDALFEDGFQAKGLAQLPQQAVALVVGKGGGRLNLHAHPPGALVVQVPVFEQ